jgi:hypothetical protein
VGFIDDDPNQHRLRVAGYPVLGNFQTLLDMIGRNDVDCVVLNTRIIAVDRLGHLEAACQMGDIDLLRLQLHVKPFSAVS